MINNDLISIIDDILSTIKYKVVSDQVIKEKKELYNKAKIKFFEDLKINHNTTKNLAITKLKLEILKNKTSNLPENYKNLVTELIKDLEDRIEYLRLKRNSY